MKKLVCTLILGIALALGSQPAFAQAKKKSAEKPAPAAEKPAAAPAETKAAKPLPMHARADSIDASAKTFTHKTKDGKEVKHVVTAKTEIKNGDNSAAFGDIKVGDYVSGLRLKKSDTEYEVVKITKFGPEEKKEKKDKKDKKGDEKK